MFLLESFFFQEERTQTAFKRRVAESITSVGEVISWRFGMIVVIGVSGLLKFSSLSAWSSSSSSFSSASSSRERREASSYPASSTDGSPINIKLINWIHRKMALRRRNISGTRRRRASSSKNPLSFTFMLSGLTNLDSTGAKTNAPEAKPDVIIPDTRPTYSLGAHRWHWVRTFT